MKRLLFLLVLLVVSACGPKLVNQQQYHHDMKHDKQQHKALKKRGIY